VLCGRAQPDCLPQCDESHGIVGTGVNNGLFWACDRAGPAINAKLLVNLKVMSSVSRFCSNCLDAVVGTHILTHRLFTRASRHDPEGHNILLGLFVAFALA
jgi:hypothetical protein